MGGFVRESSSDDYVLLGGGGHKLESGLSVAYAAAAASANYATSAGNADTVDGEHASAFAHRQQHNNLIADGNEFTFVGSGYSGPVYFNYRTTGGTNGNITEYIFACGNTGTLARLNGTGTILTSNNWSSYISVSGGSYLPLAGGTMTGSVFFNGNGIIADTPDYYPTANDLGNLNKSGTFIFGYRNTYAAGHPISFGCSININNDGNTCFQSGRFDGQKTAYNLIFQPAGGNIGIGTTSPSYKLHVNGDAGIEGNLTVNSSNINFNNLAITVGGSDVVFDNDAGRGYMRFYHCQKYTFDAQIWSYGYFDLSDIRKKNIINDVNINIYDIANAPLFKFTWKKENRYSGLHIGTSAQYWKTILPELTAIANDSDQTLSLQYDVAALCSTISIAKKTVEHEQKISYLESQITQLRNEILNLKNTESN